MVKITKESYIPSHPSLFIVDFSSRSLRAQKHFEIGETICFLEAHSKGSDTYTTFQCGPKDRIELRSDLAYVAHSCEPNIAFDLSSHDRSKWHVRAVQDIELGSPLTFFYPSTEWNLAKPFDCRCGARTCLGRVEGAKSLHREALMRRPHVNPWILFDEQACL
ncbi:hypothetical protein PILCRDRAFT_7382 [Piloderma croceum F 1598]|uniref:Post-SET domain-containing protein n=1 Tax=Piloderma croceum (strain F 1598) TaxID=765440 RepID=A0A0C3BZX4_PILCF|nr:hypothetical protein PILCRDRAFT_7382 [Piloderma croceum F 1598]